MRRSLILLAALLACPAARAESPSELVAGLRQGGYVLVMRHASAPAAPPDAAAAEPDNRGRERQLDEPGKRAAQTMGAAIRRLRLPIGAVWSSPTYRALETVRLAGLPTPRTDPALGDGGQSMAGVPADRAEWLRRKAAEAPAPGTDTIIVTQLPNIAAAFGTAAAGLGDGEALVLRPGAAAPAGRIPIADWPRLAAP